jgi:hypothetical protein
MSEASRYLYSLAQALAKMSLYSDGHPARARAAEQSFEQLRDLQRADTAPAFSFLGREVIYQLRAMPGMSDWDWAERLSAAGVQRLEFDGEVSPEEYRIFLEDVAGRIAVMHGAGNKPEPPRFARVAPIRYGAVGLRETISDVPTGEHRRSDAEELPGLDLSEEAEATQWMHAEVKEKVRLPMAEAELVVTSLSHAMRQEQQMLLPLLTLKEFDQYTTTHAINVAVLSMGLAECLGLSRREVRAFGLAGLLHDVGKVRVPHEILRNPGRLTAEETAIIRHHPVDGAHIILRGHPHHETCAVVAFEHHIMLDGTGYPERTVRRGCHQASLLVHVCDVFDALRTHRPYRVAWVTPSILAYIQRRIGIEFDPMVARAFMKMLQESETRLARSRATDLEIPAPALI